MEKYVMNVEDESKISIDQPINGDENAENVSGGEEPQENAVTLEIDHCRREAFQSSFDRPSNIDSNENDVTGYDFNDWDQNELKEGRTILLEIEPLNLDSNMMVEKGSQEFGDTILLEIDQFIENDPQLFTEPSNVDSNIWVENDPQEKTYEYIGEESQSSFVKQSKSDSNENEDSDGGDYSNCEQFEFHEGKTILLEIEQCVGNSFQLPINQSSNIDSSDNESFEYDIDDIEDVEPQSSVSQESEIASNNYHYNGYGHGANCSSVSNWDQRELHDGQTTMLDISPCNNREDGPHTIRRLLTGRRILDVVSLFEQLQDISRHSSICKFEDLVLVKEIKRGFNSIFLFDCTSCGETKKLETNPKKHLIGINEAVVLGINAIGLGMYHIEEFCSHVNIPTMSNKFYDTISKNQNKDWWELAKKSASDALEEEIRLAKVNNEVDSAGNALITITVDGSWAKRSYGRNFTSLSGCAAIIGLRTRKIIYFDIRNKYCHTCRIAKKNKTEVREHVCNKNYTGPSTGMEADIIVAGFRECELRGARFHKFIADGDSNTYKVIRDLRIYKNPDIMVEKFECVNHLYRNFEKKIIDLIKPSKKYSKDSRDCITPAIINDICTGIRMATAHWQNSDLEIIEKIYNLETDVMNAPAHYLGSHESCSSYFCKKTTEEGTITAFTMIKETKLYDDILNACQHFFADNAKSLLADLNTNDNESFNNNIAKYLAGKRVNYSLGGGYKARVARAVVQYNTGGESGWQFHSSKCNDPPEILHKMELNRKRKCTKNSEAKKLNPPKVRKFNNDKSSKAYGEHCQVPDMEPLAFLRAKERFIQKLKENQLNRISIEQKTIGQRHTPLWFEVRQNLLTSSFFSRIVNAVKRSSFTNLLDEIMYKWTEFGNSAENKHQRVQQVKALSVFKTKTKYNKFPIKDCGIFIDGEMYFLGASPFKLYGDFIVNIKCPLKQFGESIRQAMDTLSFWKKQKRQTIVNQKSSWYIEMQGQLHITKKEKALLMVWLGEESFDVVEIVRDDNFFEGHMKEKLSYFYNEVMLIELVDPRKARFLDLRKYSEELQTFLLLKQ